MALPYVPINQRPARYNAAPPTIPDGAGAALSVDVNGNLNNSLATSVSGEDFVNGVLKVEQQMFYNYISTAATTSVKATPGYLHSITVTGGTAGTIVIYDNTTATGNIIASFDSTNAIATYRFNAICALGITIVTGAATKITVMYR